MQCVGFLLSEPQTHILIQRNGATNFWGTWKRTDIAAKKELLISPVGKKENRGLKAKRLCREQGRSSFIPSYDMLVSLTSQAGLSFFFTWFIDSWLPLQYFLALDVFLFCFTSHYIIMRDCLIANEKELVASDEIFNALSMVADQAKPGAFLSKFFE